MARNVTQGTIRAIVRASKRIEDSVRLLSPWMASVVYAVRLGCPYRRPIYYAENVSDATWLSALFMDGATGLPGVLFSQQVTGDHAGDQFVEVHVSRENMHMVMQWGSYEDAPHQYGSVPYDDGDRSEWERLWLIIKSHTPWVTSLPEYPATPPSMQE